MQCFLSLLYEKIFTKFAQMTSKALFRFSSRRQLMLLLLLAVGLNLNTLFNQYAVDDIYVMTQNTVVQKGLSGIPELLTTDMLHGYSGTGAALSQARYRPLALITFALEYQFFGAHPLVSHLINVLLFAVLIALLYILLNRYLFKENDEAIEEELLGEAAPSPWTKAGGELAFITCLLFVVHPIHAEVVANVKSRDELLTFIFLIASLISLIKFSANRTRKGFIYSMVFFFFALLTRESAITFIATVPLVFYFFFQQKIKQSVLYTLPLVFITVCYLVIRYLVVRNVHSAQVPDILNSPYLFASGTQAFATKTFVLFKNIQLLAFPHPLSWDYGINQIPYIDFNSLSFLYSLVILVVLLVWALFAARKKSLLSFSILYFFVTISLATNFITDIGTPLSERLLFQPSLAFCLVMAGLFVFLNKKANLVSNLVLLLLLATLSFKTIIRNSNWKNDETIYTTDVVTSPQSLKTNISLTKLYITKAENQAASPTKNTLYKQAVYYAQNAENILNSFPHPPLSDQPFQYNDLLTAHIALLSTYPSVALWLSDNNYNPASPQTKQLMDLMSNSIYAQGNAYYEKDNTDAAIQCYLKSVELNNRHTEAWYNLGGNYYLKGDTINANKAWEEVKRIAPDHKIDKKEFVSN